MSINNYESGVVNYDERAGDIVLQTDTLLYSNFKYSGFTRKGKTKMELQQIINDKEICIDSNYFRNYFITWTLYSPSGANKVVVLQSSTVL
jgi:hypothetical protein